MVNSENRLSALLEKANTLPFSPGVYLMKDKNGCIIYVGKSKNLKNRLSSYFKQNHSGKTRMLVRDIDSFEYKQRTFSLLSELYY